MSQKDDIATLQSHWILGLVGTQELPMVAQQALAAGCDAPGLLELAISDVSDNEQVLMSFRRVLAESQGGAMTKREALKLYAREISGKILSGTLPVYDGARLIWKATVSAKEQDFHELDAFIYAASEMEDRPAEHKVFTEAIRQEASRWVSPT